MFSVSRWTLLLDCNLNSYVANCCHKLPDDRYTTFSQMDDKMTGPTCTVMVEEARVEAEVRLVWAADTVMAAGLMTWLDRVEMVPSVVMGVTREALELSTVPPARLLDTVPVTVPRVVIPRRKRSGINECVYRYIIKREREKKRSTKTEYLIVFLKTFKHDFSYQ